MSLFTSHSTADHLIQIYNTTQNEFTKEASFAKRRPVRFHRKMFVVSALPCLSLCGHYHHLLNIFVAVNDGFFLLFLLFIVFTAT